MEISTALRHVPKDTVDQEMHIPVGGDGWELNTMLVMYEKRNCSKYSLE